MADWVHPLSVDLDFLNTVALLETPSGFAFFNIQDKMFKAPKSLWTWFGQFEYAEQVIFLIDYIEVKDKSVAWSSDGLGPDLSSLIWRFCRDEKELIVGDQKLRAVIESNMASREIKLFRNDEYVVSELMWGLRNMLHRFVPIESEKITPQYLGPPCQGVKDCIKYYGINIPIEAVDRTFIAWAGGLVRCDILSTVIILKMRKECEELAPGVSSIVKDDELYAEVMAKILMPGDPDIAREETGNSRSFTPDIARKLEAAAAAANGARKKIDDIMYIEIKSTIMDTRRFPGMKAKFLGKLKSMADRCSGRQKRSHAEVVESAEGTSGQDEDCADANDEGGKKARGLRSAASW